MSECISACQRDGDSCTGYVITATACHLGDPSRSETYLSSPQPENAAFYYEALFEVLNCGGGNLLYVIHVRKNGNHYIFSQLSFTELGFSAPSEILRSKMLAMEEQMARHAHTVPWVIKTAKARTLFKGFKTSKSRKVVVFDLKMIYLLL